MQTLHPAGQSFEVDPVCGMKVNPLNPPFKVTYQDQTYYFCSELCKRLFEREPQKYAAENVAK